MVNENFGVCSLLITETHCPERTTVTKNTLEITQLYVLRSSLTSETWILDSTTWKTKQKKKSVILMLHKTTTSLKQHKYFPPLSDTLWYLCRMQNLGNWCSSYCRILWTVHIILYTYHAARCVRVKKIADFSTSLWTGIITFDLKKSIHEFLKMHKACDRKERKALILPKPMFIS